MAIHAVLLDVGGVFHLPNPDRVVAALAAAGVSVDPGRLPRAHYAGVAALETGAAGDRVLWSSYFHGYLAALGVDPDLHEAVIRAAAASFGAANLWTCSVPGCREALADLAGTGVKLAVVSNSDGTVEARLAAEGLLQVGPGPGVPVGAVVDSGAVGVEKPDPAIFRIALEALAVDAAHAVHVGDTPSMDVAGARAAGIRPVLVDPYDDHAGRDVIRVHHLREVAGLVRAENGRA